MTRASLNVSLGPPDDHPGNWPKQWQGRLLILIGEIEERALVMPLADAVGTAVRDLGYLSGNRIVDFAMAYGFGVFRVGYNMFLPPGFFRAYRTRGDERIMGRHLTRLALELARAGR